MRIILCLVSIVYFVDAYKILVYNPKFGFSHVNFMGIIADKLVEAGHSVTVLQPVLLPRIKSNGSTKATMVHVGIKESVQQECQSTLDNIMESIWQVSPTHPMGVLGPIPLLVRMFEEGCESILSNEVVINDLISQKFDLGITELFDFSAIAIFHRIGLKNIMGAHSMGLFEVSAISAGVPVLPSYMPATQGVTSDDTSFLTRAHNTLFTLFSYHFAASQARNTQRIMNRRFGSSAPDLWESVANITWYVTNSEPLIDFPKPSLHTVVDLGGLGVRQGKPLDQHWSGVMSLRPKTVLVSFGSIAPSVKMTTEMKMNLVNTFEKFPDVTFIWKYENPEETFAAHAKNIILSKWTPQNDIVADDRLTAFITHGGAGSMMEGILFGKPLLVIPLFGDQTRNAYIVKRLGMGVFYKKEDLVNSEIFYEAVNELMNNATLASNAKRAKALLAARTVSPTEKLISTVSLACEFGPQPLLRPAGASLGYIAYYNIDVLLLASVITLVSLFIIAKCVVFTGRKLLSNKQKAD